MTEKIRRSLEKANKETQEWVEKLKEIFPEIEDDLRSAAKTHDGTTTVIEFSSDKKLQSDKRIQHLTSEDLLPWHIACAQYNENGKFCLSCDEVDIDNYSTNYIQIVWDEDGKEREYWSDDALYIEGHSFHMIDGPRVFHSAIPKYDFYYDTTVDEAAWQRLKTALQERGGKHLQLLQEMLEWVGNGFEDHKSFTMMAN